MKILLIDDDKDFCLLTQKVLVKNSFETYACFDGKAGIEQARKVRPNLIFMDMMLPDLSGPEIVILFQDDPQLNTIPIVFLTGLVTGQEKNFQEEGVQVGSHKYQTLGKPYEIDTLLGMVRKCAR